MSKKPESLASLIAGIAILDLLILWYFDWSGGAFIAALVLAAFALSGWCIEAIAYYRSVRETKSDIHVSRPSRKRSSKSDDGFVEGGLVLWQGQRRIRFAYRSFETGESDREVTVRKVLSKGSDFRRIYFNGYCHVRGEPRTFRVDRIKGPVIDTATGEMATFPQLFDLSSR